MTSPLTVIVSGEIEGSIIASIPCVNDGAYFRADIVIIEGREAIICNDVTYYLN